MLRANTKNKKIKTLICGLVGIMMLSILHFPAAHATGSCFEAVGDTVDYDHGNSLHPKLKATCEMELQSIVISFADTENFEGIEELAPESIHSQISGAEISDDHLHLSWNTDGSSPYANILPGEDLFSMSYHVPLNTTTFKRNMPITIDFAQYKIGDEIRTEENVSLDAILTVTHDGKDVIMVTGIEKQEVTYSGGPIVLVGDLIVEENPANITADDLETKYYNAVSLVDQPTEPGDYYAVYFYEDDDYTASLKVPFTIKDYAIIETNIFGGHGEISSPRYVNTGDSLHVEIVPADGYEVSWVEYNGNDVTDLLGDDNSLDIAEVNENAFVEVAFRPFYQVTDGDGGEHVIGSGEDLGFVIDKDPESYDDGNVTIMVDGVYIDLNNDSIISSENQTTTLLSAYLDTLEVGEHSVEIYFFDTDMAGIARATFTVIEASENEPVTVPDTGVLITGAGNAKVTSITAILSGIMVAVVLFVARIFIKKRA